MLKLAEGAAGWIMLYNEIGKFVKLFFGLFHKFFYRSFIFAGIAIINGKESTVNRALGGSTYPVKS
jgi:hypothetical protein